ncbi:hypothetical protein G3N55_11490 [Dissulfurirhabdus thermomarina]|uniref:Uncharacterized protein n=1 Tax=Dissulfurirhabdus thermomarina TaxID=1765737 RepID=A0A6N9TQB7_DISTH|nr:cellulose biosynthesis cyclic di-GMP-binding regulatory protein BcsB [Dissulfurirhabdus thermomarina]NDY43462.1 hypothetical protein [Dissulfurirhabdus thermomarina]NMX22643.1 hypothetical protein [Dissulfurirhabdus thermomarina]
MRRNRIGWCAAAVCLAGAWLAGPACAGVRVGPGPFADRTFPYVRVGKAFSGTPLETDRALVPAVRVVVGAAEPAPVVQAAALVAAAVAAWTDDPGVTAAESAAGDFPEILRLDTEIPPAEVRDFPLVVVGTQNRLAERLSAAAGPMPEGPAVWRVAKGLPGGRDVLWVRGRDPAEIRAAARYLAHRRLYFKQGAYQGFFGFVRLRGLIERGQFAAAAAAYDEPGGLLGCGKPMMLILPHLSEKPPALRETAARRNRLVLKDLRGAVAARDGARALAAWRSAMQTCYACHLGRGGPRFRPFAPSPEPHRLHGRIASGFGLRCIDCHAGSTARAGYGH